mgnify:CR=1 FL=1
MSTAKAIRTSVAAELGRAVEPATVELATAARAAVRDVRAVLFYGSCLRDGLDPGAVADVYLLVGRYGASGQSPLAAFANRVLAPNVIYLEADTSVGRIRAKAAIVTLDHFARLTGPGTFHSYFWARFAQPCALVWSADAEARRATEAAVAQAIETFATEVADRPFAPDASRTFWIEGFRKTYASELRAEGPERAVLLYEADRARYDALYAALVSAELRPKASPARWRARRILGKALSVVRLLKGVFTFAGGLDYILWKIERHSGVGVTPKPWQRRWPLLAAPGLALHIWRRGGFR